MMHSKFVERLEIGEPNLKINLCEIGLVPLVKANSHSD